MNETGFLQSLRKRLVPQVYYLKTNLRFVKGVADIWLSGYSADMWCEAKYLKTIPPVVDLVSTGAIITPHQRQWLLGRHAEGRRVAVLVGTPAGAVALHGDTWMHPIPRDEFKKLLKPIKDLALELLTLVGTRKTEML